MHLLRPHGTGSYLLCMQINPFHLMFGESKCIFYQDIQGHSRNSQPPLVSPPLIWQSCGADCIYGNLQTNKGELRRGCVSDSWYVAVC